MQARAHPHESRRTSLQSRPSAWRCPLPACQMQTVRSQPRLHFASDLGHSDQPKIQNPIAQRTRPAGSGSGDFPTPCGVRNSTRERPGSFANVEPRLQTLSIKKLVPKLIPRSCGCVANADVHFGKKRLTLVLGTFWTAAKARRNVERPVLASLHLPIILNIGAGFMPLLQ